MGKKILLLGGGGHCNSVLDSLLTLDIYDQIGIVDKDESVSSLGIPVIGNDDDLPALFEAGWTDAFVTVGSIGNTSIRRKLFKLINEIGFEIPVIIDRSAIISRGVTIGKGSFVGKGSIINTNSKIGECSIINTITLIGHDSQIGDYVHVSSGSTICGQVEIGNDSHIGAGTVVRENITIGSNSLIGIGSVVVKNIESNVVAFGNPCKVAKTR